MQSNASVFQILMELILFNMNYKTTVFCHLNILNSSLKEIMGQYLMIKKKCDRCGSVLGDESRKTKQRFCGRCKKKFQLYQQLLGILTYFRFFIQI